MRIEAEWLHSSGSLAVMDVFAQAGKLAYFVGGCVRNHLLNAPVSDLDISTNALPTETCELFISAGFKAIPTGIEYGTVTVISGGIPYEITTFRRDVETDGRRAVVAFSSDIADDARRRDFTMNALYADASGTVIDPLDGLPDLEARRVRFIEDAEQRIAEDYLRILRFFRFHAWYGNLDQGLDAEGLAACAASVGGIATLSRERIGAEMRKLLAAPDPSPAIAAMALCGALSQVLPGADPKVLAPLVHIEGNIGISSNWLRRLSALGGEDQSENLRLSNSEARRLTEIGFVLQNNMKSSEAGYRFGDAVAQDAAIISSASTSTPIATDLLADIHRGAAAQFPVRALDLQPVYSGEALGKKLKDLETRWVESDFRLSKTELLD